MTIKKVTKNIYMMTKTIDKMLFEGMWDLKGGVTLNSYVIKAGKTAMIDGFIGWGGMPESLYNGLADINVKPEDIDYLVINHMEPDHSGWLESFKKVNDHFTVLATKKASDLIEAFYGDDINIQVVGEGDTVDLGNGKNLSFHPVPNIHWPETMLTFETSTKTLFSCDMYGAFGAMDEHVFDDELTKKEQTFFENEGIRYFSNVMTTFSKMVEKAIKKTKELEPAIIAPGHGPAYRDHPETIIDAYTRYCNYANGYGKNEVTILWGSMYGMTEQAVRHVQTMLKKENIKVNVIKMPTETDSEMIANVFRSAGIIIATPTYEYRMFPPVAHAIDEIGRKRITGKHAFRFGSYGWSGGAEKELKKITEDYRMNWTFIDSVEFKGSPKENDLKKVEDGVQKLIENMEEKIL